MDYFGFQTVNVYAPFNTLINKMNASNAFNNHYYIILTANIYTGDNPFNCVLLSLEIFDGLNANKTMATNASVTASTAIILVLIIMISNWLKNYYKL